MRLLTVVLFAALLNAPLAATAADLTVQPAGTKVVVHHVKRHKVVRVVRTHQGYYFHQWGWREGPSGRTWFGSRFALVGWSYYPPWAPRYSAAPVL